MNRHPLSAAFPNMPEDDFSALVADIKANGLQQHGWTYEGMILDGWHRFQACEEAGVKFRHEEYRGSDPVAFVKSRNLERRHLTGSQKAAAVVACNKWAESGSNQHTKKGGGEVTSPPRATVAQMAKEAGVSDRTIQKAKTAQEAGLGEAVRDGAMSVETAAALAAGRDPDAKPKKLDSKDRRIAELEETVAQLRDDLANLQDATKEATDAFQANSAILDSPDGKAILQLQAELAHVTRNRDDLQTENNSMRRQMKAMQRKLDAFEGKKAA